MNNSKESSIDILTQVNNDIIKMYKDLKKELSKQKDGSVNENILKKLAEIHRKTVELEEECNVRFPNLVFDREFVEIFERDGTPIQYYKKQKEVIKNINSLNRIKEVREKSQFALDELNKEDFN